MVRPVTSRTCRRRVWNRLPSSDGCARRFGVCRQALQRVGKHRAGTRLIWLLGLVLLTLARSGWASCSRTDLTFPVLPPLTLTKPADSIVPGTQIGSGWSGQVSNQVVFNCSSSEINRSTATPLSSTISGVTYSDGTTTFPVYALQGVQGIGFALGIRDFKATNWIAIPPGGVQTFPAAGTGSRYTNTLGWRAQVVFVATGRLKSGAYQIPRQQLARLDAFGTGGTYSPAYLVLPATQITVNASSCKVTTAVNQAVTLPAVNQAEFSGAGSTPAANKAFNVALSCDAGVTLYATMTDAANPGNTGNTLSLASGSTAAGVGLQLLRNGLATPILFGPDSSARGNTNQWFIGGGASAPAAPYNIPFIVRYVQTGSRVAPGTVQAVATITFSYQ